VLSNVSTKILPSLFKLVENLIQTPVPSASPGEAMETDDAQSVKEKQANNQQSMQFVESVTDAIGHLARVCPREFLQNLFKKVVQRLLVASTELAESNETQEENNLRLCSLLGLAQALVASGSLDEASLSLLFRAIRPLVRTDEHDPRVQKRGYKVLAEICEQHKDFVTSSDRLGDLMDLMVESIVTAQVSARHMRLKCMALIVSGFDSSNDAHMVCITMNSKWFLRHYLLINNFSFSGCHSQDNG
jgi:ribosomal RNA-processing protein 12